METQILSTHPETDYWKTPIQNQTKEVHDLCSQTDTVVQQTEKLAQETDTLKQQTEKLAQETGTLKQQTEKLAQETATLKQQTATLKQETEKLVQQTKEIEESTRKLIEQVKKLEDARIKKVNFLTNHSQQQNIIPTQQDTLCELNKLTSMFHFYITELTFQQRWKDIKYEIKDKEGHLRKQKITQTQFNEWIREKNETLGCDIDLLLFLKLERETTEWYHCPELFEIDQIEILEKWSKETLPPMISQFSELVLKMVNILTQKQHQFVSSFKIPCRRYFECYDCSFDDRDRTSKSEDPN